MTGVDRVIADFVLFLMVGALLVIVLLLLLIKSSGKLHGFEQKLSPTSGNTLETSLSLLLSHWTIGWKKLLFPPIG